MKNRTLLIPPLLLIILIPLSLPCRASAAEEQLFFIESPKDPPRSISLDLTVWDRFWIDGKEIVLVSAKPGREYMLAKLGTRYGKIPPPTAGENLYIVTAPRGIDPDLISNFGVALLHGKNVALIMADQASADVLAERGMEIAAVLPPPAEVPLVEAPAARGAESPGMALAWEAKIQEIIDAVNQSDVSGLLGNLSGESSVTIGGSPYTIQTRNSYQATPIEKATQYSYEYFQGQGLSAAYHNYTWNGNNWRNVVAEQTGYVNPGDIYIICGHLDDMPSGALAPGADDNGGGSVSVLTAATILSNYGFEKTIRYVLFTGEEQGLQGSYYYVQDCVAAGENILGALNFDMIAYDGDGDGAIEVHCGAIAASETIGDLLIDTISEYSLSLAAEKLTTGSVTASDHARFWNAGYPAILGIEDTWVGATDDFNPYYHTVNDTRANCDLSYLTEYVKAAVGTTARLGVVMATTPTPTQTPVGGLINFQPAAATPPAGYRVDDGSTFGAQGRNYGWR